MERICCVTLNRDWAFIVAFWLSATLSNISLMCCDDYILQWTGSSLLNQCWLITNIIPQGQVVSVKYELKYNNFHSRNVVRKMSTILRWDIKYATRFSVEHGEFCYFYRLRLVLISFDGSDLGNRFPHSWPLWWESTNEIHRSLVNSPHKGLIMPNLDFLCWLQCTSTHGFNHSVFEINHYDIQNVIQQVH